MKTILGSIAFIILLTIFKINIVFSQIELNKDLRELATETSNCKDTLNLTEIDIYSLPKIETSIVANNDLIKLNVNEKYSVKNIEEANCTLICYREWKRVNFLLLVYFPSKAGAGSPTLQFTTISKSGKLIDRKTVPYRYFIDPGYEPTQILKIHSENKFELETKAINRVLKNDEFVFKSKESKKEIFFIRDGKIENENS
jgi:hypothetical protein